MRAVAIDRLGTRVVVEGLRRTYGDGSGLLPTDLVIEPGEFLSVLGPSGCGKSTLLRLLAGLDRPQRGRIRFGDRVVCDVERAVFTPPRERGLGMVFQDLALWPHLSVAANVGFPLRVAGVPWAELATRVAEVLRRVDLDAAAEKMPHQLSGGQQQRVAIARALVARPSLLLLDEPLSALDAALREQLLGEIRSLATESGVTTVFVTHDRAEAMSVSDRIVVMRAGHIRQHGSPEQLYHDPADAFVAEFVGTFNPLPAGGGVRAERVRLIDDDTGPAADEVTLDAIVRAAVFTGGTYRLRCEVDGAPRPWVVPHPRAPDPGTEVRLALRTADVITLAS
ncbi:ABC transporter ATP-binding protein [Nocardia aurantia]|uniref:ABC-type quaternary amine transporter n=1 Tax=Nocardia aurantia TaxID=2585199 RepID=A0A7K0DSN7_9NOCA|nr:ABC transporter ATP-binding protein [Nocardia aurantia]MQY28382.1 Vitamin B12 import ATP-binding protein BtuD [Nocardia aurantia]